MAWISVYYCAVMACLWCLLYRLWAVICWQRRRLSTQQIQQEMHLSLPITQVISEGASSFHFSQLSGFSSVYRRRPRFLFLFLSSPSTRISTAPRSHHKNPAADIWRGWGLLVIFLHITLWAPLKEGMHPTRAASDHRGCRPAKDYELRRTGF